MKDINTQTIRKELIDNDEESKRHNNNNNRNDIVSVCYW